MTEHGLPLLRRVLTEHRRVLVPLAAAFVVNVLVYLFAVAPLAQRVANVEQRERVADQALAAALREHQAARGALTGKERASTELATFYRDVLPADLTGARRLTYLRLAQLAREAGLQMVRNTASPVQDRDSSLMRLKIEMELRGEYEDIRAFIYQLDTAPEFVVIDGISLSESASPGGGLTLLLQMSTYYQPPGA